MGWVFMLIGLGLVALVAVILTRTLNLSSKQLQVEAAPKASIDAEAIAERLARAVRFRTVSHQDPALVKGETFAELNTYLEQAFPRVHSALTREVVAEHSLLYTWQGKAAHLKPVLLMAHTDVVPAESGPEGDWTYPPFEGRIAEDYVWGRGALDDKCAVLGILEAVEHLLQEGFEPRPTVYLAFGHDEEIGGKGGAAQIAALLSSRDVQLAYVLDEGLAVTEGIVPNVLGPVALVGIAEKGHITVELTVKSEGGHSAMPPQHTAVGILSTAIHKLERNQFRARLEEPARQMFQYLAPEMPFAMRMVFANLWLTAGLVKRQLGASPATNAVVRTTTAATIFEAGVKANILPEKARAAVNFRVLAGDSINGVLEHVRRVIDDPRVDVKQLNGLGSEPSLVSDIESASFTALTRTIRQVFPEALVAPGLVLAASDSRHYEGLTDNIFRFSPIRVTQEDLNRIHGTDERISIEDYAQVVRFYAALIRNTGSE